MMQQNDASEDEKKDTNVFLEEKETRFHGSSTGADSSIGHGAESFDE